MSGVRTRPLTHAALDDLLTSKPLTHLRSVLVATGAPPARDEHFVQLEHWTAQTVASRADPQEKEILHRYAAWHGLRRLRHRIRGTHATCGQADVARRNIAAAVTFLDWLAARDLTLASCPQELTSLDFPAARWTGPTRATDTEGRWAQARQLLHYDTMQQRLRQIGIRPRGSPFRRHVPARDRTPRRHPCPDARHPHRRCRRLAAHLRRRLDGLRS
jgi:hypothetical protein